MFLAVKRLPHYAIRGRLMWFPDEYADRLQLTPTGRHDTDDDYDPPAWMWDYQRAITQIAVKKRKYAIFADCGLGKTPIFFEFARVAQKRMRNSGCLIVSPLNVVRQTIGESEKFYGPGGIGIEQVRASELQEWLDTSGGRIGITNYEALKPGLEPGRLGCLILDESAYLKSHYGKWGQVLLRLGRACDWKLCCTGTPAPNDRIEFANHAVFLDAFRNVNAFLATFFVNRGQTDNRWELKAHALTPFYRALSHWCIFLTDPATYRWYDNTENIPPIHVHIHQVPMSGEQRKLVQNLTGELFSVTMGGITHRGTMGQIGKGFYRGTKVESHKPEFIGTLIDGWKRKESSIIWCLYNAEQQELAARIADSANVTGATPYEERMEIIDGFKAGQIRTLITKPKILGLGLNLQVATRQVFSGLQDSYEQYYQAVKRSNRYGSTRPLNVHIPLTDVEEPMVQNVLRKAHRVQADAEEQERIFKDSMFG